MDETPRGLLIYTLAPLNIYACSRVLFDGITKVSKKVYQILFILILPYVGALAVLSFRGPPPPSSKGGPPLGEEILLPPGGMGGDHF
jgi:hypothetical protein